MRAVRVPGRKAPEKCPKPSGKTDKIDARQIICKRTTKPDVDLRVLLRIIINSLRERFLKIDVWIDVD